AKQSADRYPNVLAFASALRSAIDGGPAWLLPDEGSEPPPVRAAAVAPAVAEALHSLPIAEFRPETREIADAEIAPPPADAAGRVTRRLIRRMRWRLHKPRRRLALLTLAAGAALAWFVPATRGPTRAAWHRAGTQMQIMVDR